VFKQSVPRSEGPRRRASKCLEIWVEPFERRITKTHPLLSLLASGELGGENLPQKVLGKGGEKRRSSFRGPIDPEGEVTSVVGLERDLSEDTHRHPDCLGGDTTKIAVNRGEKITGQRRQGRGAGFVRENWSCIGGKKERSRLVLRETKFILSVPSIQKLTQTYKLAKG